MSTLNEMAERVHALAQEKGWHDFTESEGQFLMRAVCNAHGEVSELFEAWREGRLHEPCDKADAMVTADLEVLSCAEEELADIVIRALDVSRRLGIDIGKAVEIKHRFNETRAHRHGGKLA